MRTDGSPAFDDPRTVAALVLFGLAFGYVEGAVVVYLRALYEPLHQKLYPEPSARARTLPADHASMTCVAKGTDTSRG